MAADASQILTPFGFTSLESEIYTFLLGESAATGYRVAKAIGKPAANTYKAIEALQTKGAVLVEEGANRLCRAVPSDELLARLTREFEWRRAEAEVLLTRIGSGIEDDRIYSLKSRAQIIERARQMLGACLHHALLACGAGATAELNDAIAAAAERGVSIAVMSPVAVEIPRVKWIKPRRGPSLDEVRIVTDGSEHLLALFGRGGETVQSIWSRSVYLAVNAHRGIAAEFQIAGMHVDSVEATVGFAKI